MNVMVILALLAQLLMPASAYSAKVTLTFATEGSLSDYSSVQAYVQTMHLCRVTAADGKLLPIGPLEETTDTCDGSAWTVRVPYRNLSLSFDLSKPINATALLGNARLKIGGKERYAVVLTNISLSQPGCRLWRWGGDQNVLLDAVIPVDELTWGRSVTFTMP
jgi:hypothetical protein